MLKGRPYGPVPNIQAIHNTLPIVLDNPIKNIDIEI